MAASYEAVIGLEIHAQLKTATKIFCGCSTVFGAPPNTLVCPVCLGLPGALPVLNDRAVDLAILAALALGCTLHRLSVFARKNYFYPDLPKGYQITQYDRPVATGGVLRYRTGEHSHEVRIRRVHLEEDAGKSLHEGFVDSARAAYLDFNRSGVPLIEIVTEPDFRSAAAAAAFFERLRALLVALGVNDGNMEEGNLRADANVSVRSGGSRTFGTKTEVKNLNSFRFLQKALEFEIERQQQVVSAGGLVAHETRLFDVAAGETVAMRSTEESQDYRYFPEPDLPPLVIEEDRVAHLRSAMPELPEERKARYMSAFALPERDAELMSTVPALAAYFERVASASGRPRAAANWTIVEVTRLAREKGVPIEKMPVSPEALGRLIVMAEAGGISGPTAKQVLERMVDTGRAADDIVREEGLAQISDEAALAAIVDRVVAENPKAVSQYRAGKKLAFGFFVGQVMKATGGRANPAIVNAMLHKILDPAS